MYELRFDQSAVEVYRRADKLMVKRFNRCFEYLRENPFTHPNIKPGDIIRSLSLSSWRLANYL